MRLGSPTASRASASVRKTAHQVISRSRMRQACHIVIGISTPSTVPTIRSRSDAHVAHRLDLLSLERQPSERMRHRIPPLTSTVVAAVGTAFGLGDQRPKLHLRMQQNKESVEVVTVDRGIRGLSQFHVLPRHRPPSMNRDFLIVHTI